METGFLASWDGPTHIQSHLWSWLLLREGQLKIRIFQIQDWNIGDFLQFFMLISKLGWMWLLKTLNIQRPFTY